MLNEDERTDFRERESIPQTLGLKMPQYLTKNSKGKRNDQNAFVAGCITHASVLAIDFIETEPPTCG